MSSTTTAANVTTTTVATTVATFPKIDLVIGSDCLFFEGYHNSLLELLQFGFSQNAHMTVLLIQPERGKSKQKFVGIAMLFSRKAYSGFSKQKVI